MKFPPLELVKAVKAGKAGKLDSRIRREVRHFRYYFICWDSDGVETDDPEEMVRVTLTRRGEALLR